MKFRKLVLVVMAVFALSGAMLSTALAAPHGQDVAPVDVQSELRSGAFLGLVTTELTDRIKRVLELPEDVEGLAAMGTMDGSPADGAGFLCADVVLTVDGLTLVTPKELQRFLNTKLPGDDIEIVYFREGARALVTVTLADGADFTPDGPPAWLAKLH